MSINKKNGLISYLSILTNTSLRLKMMLLLTSLLVLVKGPGYAQGVADKEIVIEKERQIDLKPANKNFEKIKPIPPQRNEADFLYNPVEPDLLVEELSVAVAPPGDSSDTEIDADAPAMRLYLKAGGGNYRTSFAEAYFQHQYSPELSYGIHARHRASRTGEVAEEFSATNLNAITAYAKYFAPQNALRLDLDYQRQASYFYGYPLAFLETQNRDDLRQVYNTFALDANFYNTDDSRAFHYDLGLQVINLQDNFDARELQLGLKAHTAYEFTEESSLLLDAQFYWMRPQDAESRNRNYARFQPLYQLQYYPLVLRAGINVVYENDTLNSEDDIHLYPVLEADYQINTLLNVFAGIRGNMQRNSLYSFVQQNPFLGPNANLLNTNQLWEARAGFRFQILPGLHAKFETAYGRYENLPFFINSVADTARFALLYEGEESAVFQLGGELTYQLREDYQFTFR
ncbi:MAG: hypothetical protein HC880_09295 [Bacteroidia bacterium]|nr:hypothetical protein [Bacteroidia bacterium]